MFKLFKNKSELFFDHYPLVLVLVGIIFSIMLIFNDLKFLGWGLLLPFIVTRRQLVALFLPAWSLFPVFGLLYFGPVSTIKGPRMGQCLIHLSSVDFQTSNFGSCWVYKGVIRKFKSQNGQTYRSLPFSTYLKQKSPRPFANCDYLVKGEVQPSDFYGYRLKIAPNADFQKVSRTFSLAEYRYSLKKKFKKWIKSHVPFKNGRTFLIGMATGDFQDQLLAYTFSRLGLNHLLAISGFHFALLTLFLSFLLKWVPHNTKIISLGLLLSSFYLFVGNAPSLERAWLVIIFYLWSQLRRRLVSAINILALTMIIILVQNPWMLFHLGFQFSYLITFAILIYSKPIFEKVKLVLKPMSSFENYIAQLLSLNLAVHSIAILICLYHFHKFYWAGFVFNLFVPAFVSVLLFAFMSALVIYWVLPSLCSNLLFSVGYLSEKLIALLYSIPTSIDYCIRVAFFPKSLIQLSVILFFMGAICLQRKVDKVTEIAELQYN